MLRMYCRSKHGQADGLCPACRELEYYAHERLEHCLFGENKPACKQCTVHCYKPFYRSRIKDVMRFSGPRMLFRHPLYAWKHLKQQWVRKK